MKKLSVRTMCLAGLMAALCFAGNYARITVPAAVGTTSFTLGNITCILSGLLLGPIGGLASGIGAAAYDMTNPLYLNEVPLTFLNKGLMGLVAGLVTVAGLRKAGEEPWDIRLERAGAAACPRYFLAAVLGCLTYYVLYFLKSFFYNGMLIKGLEPAAAGIALLDKIPASVFNGVLAAVAAPLLAVAIRKALKAAGLRLA